ncbi:hypothetical protein FE257_001396 [Aspergillus nanangensis]|uniref:AAA+ ATPase domain-containing protein n=1 Tax=Aspergillus nanangensis TaxID=2582783 RepID=A0AAD4CF40_ASPNN|nr:hypothetical protein FE257_001396 [Aspergillus nanangensis]
MEISQQPVLHIEARIKSNKDDGIIIRTDLIRDDITKWLVDRFVVLSVGQELTMFESITVTECTGGERESGVYRLLQVELDVQAYQLREGLDQENSQPTQQLEDSTEMGEDPTKGRVLLLPSKELDGLWESLQFDQPLQATLLHAINRMVSFSARKLNKWTINWNRLILLWGPPGTGKTSLCRGLSQKLAIRMGKQYPQSKLIEINAHSLGSKYFGESSKLVAKMFENIETLLEDEEETFVCVFMDEVETLAAGRERALSGNEPFDAVRAVNALLTGLDRLRNYCNVIVVCTSNLITALDEAFLDRVDIKYFIPQLSSRAIYGIYKECLEELNRHGIIEGASFDVRRMNPTDPQTALEYLEQPTENLVIPTFDEAIITYQPFPDAIPRQLVDVATESVGLSGRTIRRLPVLSLVLYGGSGGGSVRSTIYALRTGVESDRQAKAEAHTDGK